MKTQNVISTLDLLTHYHYLHLELSQHIKISMFKTKHLIYASMLKSLPFLFFLSFVFLGPHPQHMEVPRLGAESELLPPAYATATATWDPS